MKSGTILLARKKPSLCGRHPITQYVFSALLLISFHSWAASEQFEHKAIRVSFPFTETRVMLKEGDTKIGFLHYRKLFYGTYVIHSLYIHPQYRGRRHGTHLVSYVLDVLKSHNGHTVLVQPGPFELDKNGGLVSNFTPSPPNTYRLISFYNALGFERAGWWLQKLATILYAIAGIDEDGRHLMIKRL